ncbi:hypothetical protein [Aliarcobacter butzleri]|uniref:Uncharacterized protein n=1 Tax=Aliarcobacter butzleri TaxID=28197 RepID=A0AAP4UY12_9BACT|nr:hypothetical protein [Aliarcobacter butzleri]MDN5051581.1 hypothetical protein [Aliarcobacter butzleri]MDN5074892.1 hypothetical protein [Aliarcobacter butzleri]MDN5115764.1 hypothetical protein [Aliarcobacter butzleri]MDN5131541.1 hypothetical protein [Aliarcobacter butzleri]NUW25750.1 hypothetical protein [Aliarcobacter butzleri]
MNYITGIIAIALIFCLNYLNSLNAENDFLFWSISISDIKNLIIGIIVGLLFSLILTIKTIRNFLLSSISSFMTDKTYLKKLSDKEKLELKNDLTEIIHGVDIVSNKESLFNSIKRIDTILSIPHKSIVNEYWDIKNHAQNKLLITRTQNYRIHSLKRNVDKKFKFNFRYSIKATLSELDDIKENFSMFIEVEGEEIYNLNKDNIEEYKKMDSIDIDDKYNEETNIYHFYFKADISLEKEFTKIKVKTVRVEPEDDSIALVVTDATYCSNYNFELPQNLRINNIYTQETLIPSDTKQVDITKSDSSVSINLNGWQLPGLLFVLTFERRI